MDRQERRDTLMRQVLILQGRRYKVVEFYGDYEVLMVKDINDVLHAIGCLLFPVWILVWFAMSVRGPEYARIYVDDYGVVSVEYSRDSFRSRAADLFRSLAEIMLILLIIILAILAVYLLPTL